MEGFIYGMKFIHEKLASVEECEHGLTFPLYLYKTIIMPRKYKVTGFARLFIFLMFLLPAAYFGASYYNGEDGLQNLKNLVGWEQEQTAERSVETTETVVDTNLPTDVQTLQKELSDLQRRIAAMERENQELKEQVFNKNEEIVELQRQLRD